MKPQTRILLSLVLFAGLVAAATETPIAGRQRGARDTPARRPTGTASLSGHVIAGDTSRPLARARVTILAPDASFSLSTLTDQSGAYQASDLPAGSYLVTASKESFVTVAYGARRPALPGKRLELGEGQQLRDVDIRLPRGSVVTGRLFDDGGEPIVRAAVQAMRYQYLQGEPRLVGSGFAQTDDRGQFRIWGLSPGSYLVTAAARPEATESDRRPTESSQALSYAPTYYPGVSNPGDAAIITLGTQQEYSGVDFMLQVVPVARVSGTVVSDTAIATPTVILAADDPRGVSAGSTSAASIQDDGSFVFSGVAPGRYIAIARATPATSSSRGGAPLIGIAPVAVAGQDVAGLSLQLSPGGTIAGWITSESETRQRLDPSQVRLSTSPSIRLPFVGDQGGRGRADGSFLIQNLVAVPQYLRVQVPSSGWTLKGIFQNGRDVSDQPIEVKTGQPVGGLQVVLTDRVTTLVARAVDGASQPVADCYVVVFSTDAGAWRPRSRAVQGQRPGADGTSTFSSLPPGDYYAAVVDDIEPGSWYEPSVLEGLRKTATHFSLQEGDTRTVVLKVN